MEEAAVMAARSKAVSETAREALNEAVTEAVSEAVSLWVYLGGGRRTGNSRALMSPLHTTNARTYNNPD